MNPGKKEDGECIVTAEKKRWIKWKWSIMGKEYLKAAGQGNSEKTTGEER